MPSILYSTTCSIKNDRYRLSIVVNDDQNSSNTDSIPFTPTDISTEQIIPAVTQLNLEYLNEGKKSTTALPKSIMLNCLLDVQHSQVIWKNNRKKISTSVDSVNDLGISTPALNQASQRTLDTIVSEADTPQAPVVKRQRSLARFFSTQSNVDNETVSKVKSLVKLSYVDVSNSVRWRIKRLELNFDSEALAKELHANVKLCLSTLTQRPTHLLVFVNPLCGKGKGRRHQGLTNTIFVVR